MTIAKTNPAPYTWRDQDGPPRPGIPLHHAWSTRCACCSAQIAGRQTTTRAGLRICRDRQACAQRRKGVIA